MVSSPSTSHPSRLRRPPPLSSLSRERFKGVRRRSWGRWVSEIRIPHSREKIWLGSYSTAEQAARAYDIASLLLRGPSCSAFLNFADSTALMSADHQLAALVAKGDVPSPRTIQATASAAANSIVPKDGAAAACSNGDGRTRDMEDDNSQRSSGTLITKDCDVSARPQCTDQCMVETERATHANMFNSMPEYSCWVQDVLTLIISPKDKSCSPPFLSSCSSLQLSPSVGRCISTASPSSSTPAPILNSSLHGLASSSKTPSPDGLLQMLFDDFQYYPLDGLIRDGFTAVAPAVTTRTRFDTETVGASCDADSTQLWS